MKNVFLLSAIVILGLACTRVDAAGYRVTTRQVSYPMTPQVVYYDLVPVRYSDYVYAPTRVIPSQQYGTIYAPAYESTRGGTQRFRNRNRLYQTTNRYDINPCYLEALYRNANVSSQPGGGFGSGCRCGGTCW